MWFYDRRELLVAIIYLEEKAGFTNSGQFVVFAECFDVVLGHGKYFHSLHKICHVNGF